MEKEEFLRLQRSIYYFFKSRGLRQAIAEELTQETFLQACRSSASYRGDAALGTWVIGIAKRVWLRYCRDQSAEKRFGQEVPLDDLVGTRQAKVLEDPLQDSIEAQEKGAIRAAMNILPDEQRRCLQLRHGQDMSYRDIAAAQQVPVDRVKSNLFEARKKLKHHFVEPTANSGA